MTSRTHVRLHALQSGRFIMIITGLTALHIAPFWLFRYFPSQDGPSHIENAYMLLHYFDKGMAFRNYYQLALDFTPNWFSHAALALLMTLFSPVTAEKILLTSYVLVFVAGMLYFLKSVDKGSSFLILFAFPFTYNLLFHKGFYNFVFSVPLMFLIVGFWWRRRDYRLDWKLSIGLNLLLLFLYFCHLVSLLLAIGSLLFLAALHYRLRVRETIAFAAALTPSYMLPLYYLLKRSGQTPANSWRPGGSWRYLSEIGSLVPYGDIRDHYLSLSMAILLGSLIIYTLAREKGAEVRRLLRMQISSRDGFIALAVIFSLFSVYMPNALSGGTLITHRLNLYPFLIILPWLETEMPKPAKYLVGFWMGAAILLHLGFAVQHYKVLNEGLSEYVSGIQLVGRNETILPINFSTRDKESGRIGVYSHAVGYYCADAGAINLDNYEARTRDFPLQYRSPALFARAALGDAQEIRDIRPWAYAGQIDYILLWDSGQRFAALKWIEASYRLIHSEGRLKLYKRAGSPGEIRP